MNPETGNCFRTAVYIRLSREDGDREESDSVANQRTLLTAYVRSQPDLSLQDFYVDDGFSGTTFDRPGFKRMLAAIETGRADCVLVKDLSRFGRDYLEAGRYLERVFPSRGVRFISVSDHIDSARQAYDLMLPIKNILNEQYAKDISEKIRATLRAKQEAGQFIGAFAGYGYRKAPDDKNRLVIDPYAASVVRRIFSLYLQGIPKRRIAHILNEEGILSPSAYKRTNGEHFRCSRSCAPHACWTYSTIHDILNKELYAGSLVQGTKRQQMHGKQRAVPRRQRIVVSHTHEAIIDPVTWARTQALLGRQARPPAGKRSSNPYAGLVFCADCGMAMVHSSWKRKDGTCVRRLTCGSYKRNGAGHCSPHTLSPDVLDEIIRGDFRTLLSHTERWKELLCAPPPPEEKEHAKHLPACDMDALSQLHRLRRAAYEDYRADLLSAQEFLSCREDLSRKEALLRSAQHAAQKKRGISCPHPDSSWLRQLLQTGEISRIDRILLTELVREIRVFADGRIQIFYRFSDPSAPQKTS